MNNKKLTVKTGRTFDEFVVLEALKMSYIINKPAHDILMISREDMVNLILQMDGVKTDETR
jgi:hypothetical protein